MREMINQCFFVFSVGYSICISYLQNQDDDPNLKGSWEVWPGESQFQPRGAELRDDCSGASGDSFFADDDSFADDTNQDSSII